MSLATRTPVVAFALRYLSRLRFPYLFAVAAGLLVLNLMVPDPIPLVDELLFATGTLLLGVWRKRGKGTDGADSDSDPA